MFLQCSLLFSILRRWIRHLLTLRKRALLQHPFSVFCRSRHRCSGRSHNRPYRSEELRAEASRATSMVDRSRHLLRLHNLCNHFQHHEFGEFRERRKLWLSDDTKRASKLLRKWAFWLCAVKALRADFSEYFTE